MFPCVYRTVAPQWVNDDMNPDFYIIKLLRNKNKCLIVLSLIKVLFNEIYYIHILVTNRKEVVSY